MSSTAARTERHVVILMNVVHMHKLISAGREGFVINLGIDVVTEVVVSTGIIRIMFVVLLAEFVVLAQSIGGLWNCRGSRLLVPFAK